MNRKKLGRAIVSAAPLSTPLTESLMGAYPGSPLVTEEVRHVRV